MNTTEHSGKKQFYAGIVLFVIIWFAGLIPLDRLFIRLTDQYNAEILKDTVIQDLGAVLVLLTGWKMGVGAFMGLGKPSPVRSWLHVWPLVLMAL